MIANVLCWHFYGPLGRETSYDCSHYVGTSLGKLFPKILFADAFILVKYVFISKKKGRLFEIW